MLSCRMDVALHQTNRAVTQDRRQRGKVDPCLRETGCESVAEVVKDEREYPTPNARGISHLQRTRA